MRLTNRRYRAMKKMVEQGAEANESIAAFMEAYAAEDAPNIGEIRLEIARLRNQAACARQGLAVIEERFHVQRAQNTDRS